jgi:hypothetical protein
MNNKPIQRKDLSYFINTSKWGTSDYDMYYQTLGLNNAIIPLIAELTDEETEEETENEILF